MKILTSIFANIVVATFVFCLQSNSQAEVSELLPVADDVGSSPIIGCDSGQKLASFFNSGIFEYLPESRKTLENVIIFFDCDDVLLYRHYALFNSPVFRNSTPHEVGAQFSSGRQPYDAFPQMETSLSNEDRSYATKNARTDLVYAEMPVLISDLISRGSSVICATQCTSNEATRKWRNDDLKNKGFCFSQGLLGRGHVSIPIDRSVSPKFGQSEVTGIVYDNDSGCLYCGSVPKAWSIAAFLQRLFTEHPDKFERNITVILVDDNLRNIERADCTLSDAEFSDQKVNYIGIHFTAVEKMRQNMILDSDIINCQVCALHEHRTMLSNADAHFIVSMTQTRNMMKRITA